MGCLSSDSFGGLLTGDFSSTFISLGEPARVAFMSTTYRVFSNILQNSTFLLIPPGLLSFYRNLSLKLTFNELIDGPL